MFSVDTGDNVTMSAPGAGCQHTSSMAYIAAIVIGVCRLFSSLTLARILMTFSRRTMYFTSLVLTILSLLLFSTFSFMIRQHASAGAMFSLQVGSFLSSCVLVISVQVTLASHWSTLIILASYWSARGPDSAPPSLWRTLPC